MSNLLFLIKGYIKNTAILVLLFLLAELSRVAGFIPAIPMVVIYGIFVAYAVYELSKLKRTEVLYVALLIYVPLEIIITSPPLFFNPWVRYGLFVLVLVTSSGMLQSDRLRQNRERLFELTCASCAILGAGSFFARFLGINYMVMGEMDFVNNVGLFGGLTTHSMLLGPIAGVGTIFLMRLAFTTRKRIWWVLAALSLMSVMFAASRSAFVATVAAIMVYVYLRSKKTNAIAKYLLGGLLTVAVTMPMWQNAMSGLIEKQYNNTESGGTFSSREDKWTQRIEEFKSSPIVGYGFVSVDPANKDNSIGFDGNSLEPGSSWLSALSMLGLVGFVLIMLIYKNAFMQVYLRNRDPYLTSILALFTVNMCTEGYIFFGGSFLCFMFWLTIGVCTDKKYTINQVSA